MRDAVFSALVLLIVAGIALPVPTWSGQAPQPAPQQPTPAPPQAPAPTAPGTPQAPAPQPPARPVLSVVVLDPAHGGADTGARGESGAVESELVLGFARLARAELERQGLRVVLTRQGNENPSFDERSAVANGQHGAVFISLHVSSTGPVGTARAYSFPAFPPPETKPANAGAAARSSLLSWDRAQEPYLERSRRLAEIIQVGLGQKFRGSPEVPAVAVVRQLRTVAAPAIAIEISSVSLPDRKQLEQMGPALAEAVARAVAAFRPLYEAGAR